MGKLHVFADKESFIKGSAEFIADIGARAIADRGRFTLALSGGSTPKPIYTRLATPEYRDRLDWSRTHIFFGDERCVPPDDSRSNYRMVREAWFEPANLPAGNIYRIRGEDDQAVEALRYEQEIARLYRTRTFPPFDLILLGMGDNGHTASLFPGTASLRETVRWVVPQYVEVMQTWRVTFTAPLINAARHVAFMAEGAAKAQMLWNVLKGPFQPDVLPSQLIQPSNGELHWLVDAAAAAQVEAG
jgi:6-phosphogluconolactonase